MVWAGDEEMAPSTSSMQIVVTRVDAHRYSTLVERDGVRLRVPGYASIRSLPHDLAHFVVEGSLGLDRGFWGSVADGAQEVGGMTRDLRVPVAAGTLLRDCQRGVRPQEAGCRSRGVEFAPDSPLEKPDSNPRSLSGLNPFRAGGTGNRDVARLQNGRSFHGGTEGSNPLCSSKESIANVVGLLGDPVEIVVLE